jgi:hypothetical protein
LIVAIVLIVVVVVAVVAGIVAFGFFAARVSNTISREQVTNIANGQMAVAPGTSIAYQMTIPVGASNIYVTGTFSASGGTGNNVEILVMDQFDYVNWHSGSASSAIYDSGQVTTGNISAHLPSSGIYYLVYSNTFSTTTQKNVQTTVYLYYLA